MNRNATLPRNIQLYYSNEAEALLDVLAANLQLTKNSLSNPLTPIVVAVPNTNVAQWLSYGISERLGISANIDFIFLEKVFRRLIARILPEAIVLNKTTVEAALVLFLSSSPWKSNVQLSPIGEYINHGSDTENPNTIILSARVFSLASQLAQAFDDYSLSRHEMLSAWNKSKLTVPKEHRLSEMEQWQSALWRALFGASGFFETQTSSTGKRYGFLGDLFAECIEKAKAQNLNLAHELGATNTDLHFFGFSYVATGYIKMFGTLSEHFAVRFYALNPCAEYWEDSKTLFEEHREHKKKGPSKKIEPIPEQSWEGESEDLLNLENGLWSGVTKENLALRLWGKPGREYTRALQSLTNCEFESYFRDPTRKHNSLLTHLQRCILLRMPKPEFAATNFHKDESINYLSCKGGPKRELEAIANEIWKLVNESADTPNPLRFNEIAIILPASEKETYESLIHTVFHEASRLPHRIIDSTARATNPLVDAFARFLELPFADNTRGPLLRFLTSPAVLERHGGTAQRRVDAAAIAHIFVGSNANDLKNTYISSDSFNWDQGLFRLTLGTLMKGATQQSPSVFTNHQTQESYSVEDAIDSSEVRPFVVLARSVLADLEFIRTNVAPLNTWLTFFRAALSAYLPTFPDESDDDSAMRSQCHSIISELQELSPNCATPIDGHTAARFLLSRVQKLTTGENGLGLDGVMIASFLPMRPIPLRVLFVVGMGEGHFPSTDKHGPLDLRAARRRVADVTPREQDKYMFLETLLSVREKLYVSWVARDQTDNESLEPSGLVHELNQTLVEMGANPIDVKLSTDIPLRRWTDASTFNAIPEVNRERACMRAQTELRAELANCDYPDKHIILERIPEATKQTLGIANFATSAPAVTTPERARISLRTLCKFLKNPIIADAEDKLHLKIDEYEEEVDVFEEPTGIDSLKRMSLIRDSVCEALLATNSDPQTSPDAATSQFRKLKEEATLRGDFPVGILGEREATTIEESISAICESLLSNSQRWDSTSSFSFGEDSLGSRAQIESPIVVNHSQNNTASTCRIVGSMSLFQQNTDCCRVVVFSMRAETGFKQDPLPDYAAGILQLCALRTLRPNIFLPEKCSLTIVLLRNNKTLEKTFQVPSPSECENFLTTLASEYLEGRHCAFLPSKAISSRLALTPETRWANINQPLWELWQQEQDNESVTANGKTKPKGDTIPNIETYLPPLDAAAIYSRRFDFLLNLLVHEGKKK